MSNQYRKDPDALARLSPTQRRVTQGGGTEPAFRNEFWDSKDAGIYVDVVSGEPLFASVDKFDSRTGWPSFTRPIDAENVVERREGMFFLRRTEVRSAAGDSHLGHVFGDGPTATGGLRYCINSAALRFVPHSSLETEGYGAYMTLFSPNPLPPPAARPRRRSSPAAASGAPSSSCAVDPASCRPASATRAAAFRTRPTATTAATPRPSRSSSTRA
nr:hypothetical protein GCM10025699_60770 [Microbacterium flavescens]